MASTRFTSILCSSLVEVKWWPSLKSQPHRKKRVCFGTPRSILLAKQRGEMFSEAHMGLKCDVESSVALCDEWIS